MENKKLIKILLKDMVELEELISEVKTREKFETLEIDFIHTRAKGILQLLNMLDKKVSADTQQIPASGRDVIPHTEITEREGKQVPKQEVVSIKEETAPKKEMVPKKETAPKEETAEKEGSKQINTTKPLTEKTVRTQIINGEMINEDEMLEESAEIADTKSRLGDSFLKGKSINDLITEHNKLEFKLSNLPVSSIKAAIGINDRFQYIRELFDNDAGKFTESVDSLDSMKNEKEAADYLRANFKWKKNETSLKFINLVKRRFHHE